jgi:hypothetical protein
MYLLSKLVSIAVVVLSCHSYSFLSSVKTSRGLGSTPSSLLRMSQSSDQSQPQPEPPAQAAASYPIVKSMLASLMASSFIASSSYPMPTMAASSPIPASYSISIGMSSESSSPTSLQLADAASTTETAIPKGTIHRIALANDR